MIIHELHLMFLAKKATNTSSIHNSTSLFYELPKLPKCGAFLPTLAFTAFAVFSAFALSPFLGAMLNCASFEPELPLRKTYLYELNCKIISFLLQPLHMLPIQIRSFCCRCEQTQTSMEENSFVSQLGLTSIFNHFQRV